MYTTGTGLNLQAASYRVIFTTPSYVPADELQGIGRVVRHGQEQPVVIYRFLMEPCDARVMSIQFAKMSIMEESHGGYGDLPHLMLGDAVNDEPMLQVLTDQYAACGASGSGTQQPEAEAEAEDSEDEDPRPSKRAKGKGKGKAKGSRRG